MRWDGFGGRGSDLEYSSAIIRRLVGTGLGHIMRKLEEKYPI